MEERDWAERTSAPPTQIKQSDTVFESAILSEPLTRSGCLTRKPESSWIVTKAAVSLFGAENKRDNWLQVTPPLTLARDSTLAAFLERRTHRATSLPWSKSIKVISSNGRPAICAATNTPLEVSRTGDHLATVGL